MSQDLNRALIERDLGEAIQARHPDDVVSMCVSDLYRLLDAARAEGRQVGMERPPGAGWSEVPTQEAAHPERLSAEELRLTGAALSEWAWDHLAKGYGTNLTVREVSRLIQAVKATVETATPSSDRAEGVAALQQAGDHVAEVGKLIDLPTGPVAWARSTVIRDRDGYSIGSDEPEVHWGPTYPEDETDWFPLFALSQQPAEQIAENANCSPEPAAEPVAWRILDQFGTALALCALKPTDLIVGETLQPLYASPLPQQTDLVEEGVEKIIGQHEPAACGEGTLPSPSDPPRSAGQRLCESFAATFEGGGWADAPEWENYDEHQHRRWERAAEHFLGLPEGGKP